MLFRAKVDSRIIIKRFISVFSFTVSAIVLLYLGAGPGAAPTVNGQAATTSFNVSLQVTSEINISAPDNVIISPAISGITGNLGSPSSGSTSFTVITNSNAGFSLTLETLTDPALATGTDNFSDYEPVAVGTPDYSWQSPSVGSATFGFSVGASGTSGDDASQIFKYSGSTCDAGSTNFSDNCWFGFDGTNSITVVNRTSSTGAGGVTETLTFKVESNAKFLRQDSYSATIIVTVNTNS